MLPLLGFAVGFLASIAVAADTKLGGPAPLRVGVSPVFPSMVFKQGKELTGVEVDLARALGESLGRKVVLLEVLENSVRPGFSARARSPFDFRFRVESAS